MTDSPYRRWIALMGAGLCLAAFWAAGATAWNYMILYGRHGWGAPETAFLMNFLLLGVPCAALLTASLSDWLGGRLGRGFDRMAAITWGRARLAAAAVSLLAGGLIVLARYGLLRNTAITDDENAYDFMARMWAGGSLVASSPPIPVRPFFDNQFIVNDGRWFGIYPPGHPAMLTLGEWLGLVHWVTTAEAVLTVFVAWALADRVFGRRAGLLALVLLAVSPFFLLTSATMLPHPTAALSLIGFLYSAARVLDTPSRVRWWFAAGAALGFTGLTRPVAAVAFSAPWLVILAGVVRRDRDARPGAVGFVLLGIAAVALFAAYNAAVTGNPFRTGYQEFSRVYHYPLTLGRLPGPAPIAALYDLFYALARLNFWLFGWPVSLLFVPLALRTPVAWGIGLGSATVLLAYAVALTPSINVVGPVHYAELAVPLIVLSASGIEQTALRLRAAFGAAAESAVLSAPAALTVVATFIFWPVHAPSLRLMADIARAPYDLVERSGIDNAVVFVGRLPALETAPGAWVYRHRNNSPDLSDRVLFVNDRGPENSRLLSLLPGRKPYRMGTERGALTLLPLRLPGAAPPVADRPGQR